MQALWGERRRIGLWRRLWLALMEGEKELGVGIPDEAVKQLRALLKARTHAIDLGVMQRDDGAHYFAVVAGTGFDAQLMAATGPEQKRRWKFVAYIARAALSLPTVHSVLQY